MSLFILDTDILSLNQTGDAVVRQRIAEHVSVGQIAVTIISVEEQLSGWYSLRRRVKRRADVAYAYQRFSENMQLLKELQILSFPETAIDKYEQLLRLKLGVRGNDLRIAVIALDNSAILSPEISATSVTFPVCKSKTGLPDDRDRRLPTTTPRARTTPPSSAVAPPTGHWAQSPDRAGPSPVNTPNGRR